MKELRRYAVAFLIAVGAGVVAYGLTSLRFFEGSIGQVESATLDYRVRSSTRTQADSSDVRLVLFDSSYIASWPYLAPFPRAALAKLVDAAAQGGAKAIGLDVYLDRKYDELNAIDNGDALLRDAIQRAGNVILVAPTDTIGNTNRVRRVLPPDPYFADVAAGVASADLPTPYETIRDGVLTVRTEHGLFPSFALALYAEAKGLDIDSLLAAADQQNELRLPGLPTAYGRLTGDATQTLPIFFEGPPSRENRDDGAFKAVSALALAQLASVPSALAFIGLQDKIVIMGSGWHESERFRTPFYDARPKADSSAALAGEVGTYGWTYGPEIHANALQNLLSRHFVVPLAAGWKLLLLIAVAAAVAVMTFARGAKWGGAMVALLAIATSVAAFIVFYRTSVVIPIVAPTMASLFAFLGSTSYVSIVEGKEKRMIKGAFGKYLAPAVVEELMNDPSRLKLGGDRRHISMLFSDLAGFTSMSEVLDPQKLVAVLNEYLHEMAELVKDEGGMVDKYIGDAVMALYGAPNALPDHAVRVCRTALRMQRRLGELNDQWTMQDPDWHSLKVRIGINTGEPVVGNIGGVDKIDYTALGDSVNLAARLEPACKTYGVGIMIAQQTREEAGDEVQVRELDMLAVYGKKEPVRVYELLAMRNESIGNKAEVLEQYSKGLATFRNRDFELALQYFKAALELDPNDGPSVMYVERCEEYMVNPPPADWDFVERRQVK